MTYNVYISTALYRGTAACAAVVTKEDNILERARMLPGVTTFDGCSLASLRLAISLTSKKREAVVIFTDRMLITHAAFESKSRRDEWAEVHEVWMAAVANNPELSARYLPKWRDASPDYESHMEKFDRAHRLAWDAVGFKE